MIERQEIDFDGHLYQVTGSPSIEADRHAMVEIFMPETAFRYNHRGYSEYRCRSATWRRIRSANKRSIVRAACLRKAAFDSANERWPLPINGTT